MSVLRVLREPKQDSGSVAQSHQGTPQRLVAEAAVLAAIFIPGYVEMKI